MKKNKRQNAITLIALVITIIVLLILAGVALSLVMGENGITERAVNAGKTQNMAGAKEKFELDVANYGSEFYQAKYVNGEAVGSIQSYIMGKITADSNYADGYTLQKNPNDEPYQIKLTDNFDQTTSAIATIEENGKVIWDGMVYGNTSGGSGGSGESGNSGGSGGSTPVTIPENFEIGTTVTYSPSKTYNWDVELATSDREPSTIQLSTSEDFGIASWKVFSIDETTGEIELISTRPTTGEVRLQGAQGYNNIVYLLNDACDKLYGNGTTIRGRNVNIDDIENRMTTEALASVHNSGTIAATYGQAAGWAYTSDKKYPLIYNQEKNRYINGQLIQSGLTWSQQSTPIHRTDTTDELQSDGETIITKSTPDGLTLGAVEATTSIQPYHTMWENGYSSMADAFKEGTDYDLLMTDGTNTTDYLIASRAIQDSNRYWGMCYYYLFFANAGGINSKWIYSSTSDIQDLSGELRPIITLNVSDISGDSTSGFNIE